MIYKVLGCLPVILCDINVQCNYFLTNEIKNRDDTCFQFSSVAQSCLPLCDPMGCSTPGLPVYHQLPKFTQTHAH